MITAFNFPVAVWSWNSLVGAVCGDTMIWKPSSQVPLTAIAVTRIAEQVMAGTGFEGVFNLLVGSGREIGDTLINDRRVPLISATGSCGMGEKVGTAVGKRLGRSLLELGGNNAVVVLEDADLDLVTRAVLFGAVGTAGQRCTTIRRMITERGITSDAVKRLVAAYEQIPIGDPLDSATLMGPLINSGAVDDMMAAIGIAKEQGGTVLYGGNRVESLDGHFVEPTIIQISKDAPIVQEETFAPILYVIEVDDVEEAIEVQNGVRQGLSSAIFTNSMKAGRTVPIRSWVGLRHSQHQTSALRAPRSVEPSAARRRPVEGASPARTHGRLTCGARPSRSTGEGTCPSPRASNSVSDSEHYVRLKGGYSSTRPANHAFTLAFQRVKPAMKSNIPFGKLPVKRMAKMEMIHTTKKAMATKRSTIKCGSSASTLR